MAFAKLFEIDGFGQVLAMLGTNDDGRPMLQWFTEPPGLGVCCVSFSFSDDDNGHDVAESALAGANEESAKKVAMKICKMAGITVPAGVDVATESAVAQGDA